jgi:mono/diheme cytochrome c family protein
VQRHFTACAFATLLLAGVAAAESGPSQPVATDQGRRLVLDVCTSCHDLKRVKIQHLSREEWRGVIKGMISEGGPVTDEEMSMIVDYLAASFGPLSQ